MPSFISMEGEGEEGSKESRLASEGGSGVDADSWVVLGVGSGFGGPGMRLRLG